MPPDATVHDPALHGHEEAGRGAWVGGRLSTARAAALNYLGVGGVLLALCVYLTATEDRFLTRENITIVLDANAVLLVVATGLTFVMLTGGFDLSLGGTLALSEIVLFELISNDVDLLVATAIIVAGGTVLGLLANGFTIARLALSFLVVTLATGFVFRGVAFLRTDGETKSLFEYQDRAFAELGSGKAFWEISWQVVVSFSVALLAILVLRYTGYGRMVYAVGGNPEAARLAGINVTAVRMSVYAIAAGLAGLAGVMHAARLASAAPTAEMGIELTAAAAVLLGGTTFMGGRGTVLGTILGVLFLGVLSNGITLQEVSPYWQQIVVGIVLVLALLVDRLRYWRSWRR